MIPYELFPEHTRKKPMSPRAGGLSCGVRRRPKFLGRFCIVLSVAAPILRRLNAVLPITRLKNWISVGDRITGSPRFFHVCSQWRIFLLRLSKVANIQLFHHFAEEMCNYWIAGWVVNLTDSTSIVVPWFEEVFGSLDIFTVASFSLVVWKPIPIEEVVWVHKKLPFPPFLSNCIHMAPPSFSLIPSKNSDSANFSFMIFWRDSMGVELFANPCPHSFANRVLTRCSPQPVVLTATLDLFGLSARWAQQPHP